MRNLLRKIEESNIQLEIVEGRLKITAGNNTAIDPALLAEIREQKEALMQLLADNIQDEYGDSFKVNIPVANNSASYPLSASQRMLWVLSHYEASNVAYNMPGVYVFEGRLDLPAFESSLHTLLERHENLRTIFREDEQGDVRQFIQPAGDTGFSLAVHDLRHTPQQDIVPGAYP
jgi:hypothetical protein